jgi:stringent starvation protein B
MAPTARLPPKKDVALALLEQASMYIHLDPRADTVQVPAWFKKQPQLVLQVGLNMAVPIPDLHVDEQGLSCTLSFNRAPFFCMIPWRAVFALVGEKGQAMVWAEDVPAEVAAQAQAQKAPPEPSRPRGHLRSVTDGESAPAAVPEPAAASTASAEKAAEPKRSKRPAAKKSAPAPVKPAAVAATAKRAAKAAAKTKPASKPAAKKVAPSKQSAAKKPIATKPVAKKPIAPEPARQKVAAQAKPAEKPILTQGSKDGSKPKRELPPYLRVVK